MAAVLGSEFSPIFQQLGLAPPSELQLTKLSRYLDLLQHWNATYNLTAVRERNAMITQHLADCLSVIPALQRECPAGCALDVGSGGGLPGVIIAIMLPDVDMTCVDAVGKKAAFVRQVAGTLCLTNLHAVHSRVEALKREAFDWIISRAFATLAEFVTLTNACLKPQGYWIAMKGRVPDEEISSLPAGIDKFHVEHIQVPGLHAQRCLVWLRRSLKN